VAESILVHRKSLILAENVKRGKVNDYRRELELGSYMFQSILFPSLWMKQPFWCFFDRERRYGESGTQVRMLKGWVLESERKHVAGTAESACRLCCTLLVYFDLGRERYSPL